MIVVVVPSKAGVVVTPPRPKPPRRVKDEAESERRIAIYQQQRAVYEEAKRARKLSFMQRKEEPLEPKPPLPKKPRKPRDCKDERPRSDAVSPCISSCWLSTRSRCRHIRS